jgi:phosphate transport system protein
MARLMDMALEELTGQVLEMATLSEKSVAKSIEAYSLGKNYTTDIRRWSDELRRKQDDVSELAIELIARYQPVATDLRFITSCMEISYGFSRFGRYAFDIAEVLEVFGDLSDCDHSTVDVTAKVTMEMMGMSIEAFAKRDIELARSIAKLDNFVDEKYREHISNVLKNKDSGLKCAMSATLILRYLERISDHSAYIGDSVLYIVSGERAPRK